MEAKTLSTISNGVAKSFVKPGVSFTFSPKVTRAQLISNLDRILNELGCTGCGLNGLDYIQLKCDPYPELINIREDFRASKLENVIRLEIQPGSQIQTPQIQTH